MPRIVLIAGFEAFNTQLYQQAADVAQQRCADLDIRVFCETFLRWVNRFFFH